jgi:tricorn protease-like protein
VIKEIKNENTIKSKIRAISFSIDGNYLACGSENSTITIYDVEKNYSKRVGLNHDNQVVSLKWHHEVPLLLSTSADNSAILWTE